MSRKHALRSHGRRTLAGERGQALIEFALVLPILLLLVYGIVDFGKAFGYKNDETHLANEAARYASVNNSPVKDGSGNTIPQSLNNYIENTAPAGKELRDGGGSIEGSGVTVTFSFPNLASNPTAHCVGDPVQVRLTATYDFLRFLTKYLKTVKHDIVGSATMRLEKSYKGDGTDAYVVPPPAGGWIPCP